MWCGDQEHIVLAFSPIAQKTGDTDRTYTHQGFCRSRCTAGWTLIYLALPTAAHGLGKVHKPGLDLNYYKKNNTRFNGLADKARLPERRAGRFPEAHDDDARAARGGQRASERATGQLQGNGQASIADMATWGM